MDQEKLAALADQLAKKPKQEQPAEPIPGTTAKSDVLGISNNGCSVLNAVNKAKDGLLAVLTVPEAGEAEALTSECDEQLLLSITLAQPSKISSIRVAGTEAALAPSTIKLYVNKDNLSFDDVEDLPATQTIEMTGASAEIKLNFVKFQNVSTLTVFIEGNQGGDDVTALSRFHLIGQPIHTTNMSELKKGG